MPHDHQHADGHENGNGAAPGRLKIALAATAVVAVVELGGGYLSGSLALVSDAAHVTMDVVALALALLASLQAQRPATFKQSFGFARLEILGALANGGLLFGVTIAIAIEAVQRFLHPVEPEGGLMIGVAAFGLIVNLSVGLLLARSATRDLNMRAALVHVAGDALGAIVVIVGGALILLTRQAWIDPLLSLLVGAIIITGVVSIFRSAAHVLLESAPDHAEIPVVRDRLRSFGGVVDVHDLHVWSIGSGTHVLSAHVVLEDKRISEASTVLREIDAAMRRDFDIGHVTVQFECESCDPDDAIVCTQVQSPPMIGALPG
ncbi:MAG: cation diffusion facilitator family transporter [Candidatus Velthaea sp.]|jgi:cobalt-zinc-cadmium efflux system protein